MESEHNLAPIVLFVYNRPWHTEQTLTALSNNELADKSALYVYADGPKPNASAEQRQAIADVRDLLRSKQWCGEVHIVESNENKGLADSIVGGVTEVVNQHGRIIVLEDDIVTSRGFLRYMNDALDLYENNERVMHISAFWPNAKVKNKETFFLRFMSCWGWATWKRSWKYLITDTQYIHDGIIKNREDFNLSGTHNFFKQIERNLTGELETWAIKWYASIFLQNGLCLHPNCSLVQNIGITDGSGVNYSDKVEVNPYSTPICNFILVKTIEVKEDLRARRALENFYYRLRHKSFGYRLRRKLKKNLKKYLNA